MKTGLLVGILLVLIATTAYAAPKPAAQELVTHTVTIVGGEPENVTEPVMTTHAVYLYQGEPYRVRTITAMWPGPESEPGFYKLTTCPTPVPTVIHTLSFWTATERAKLGMNQSWGLEIYPRIPDRPTAAELPPMPPTDEEVSQFMLQFPPTTTIWPPLESTSTGVHTITVTVDTATAWSVTTGTPPLLMAWQDLETLPGTTTDLPIWPGRELIRMDIHTWRIWPGPELWPLEVTDEHGMAAWAAPAPVYFYALTTWAAPELVTLDLYPGWNLVRNPYVYEGAPQPLFRYLQIWWNLERLLP